MDHSANPAWPAEHAWPDGTASGADDAAATARVIRYMEAGYEAHCERHRAWLALAKTEPYKAVQQLTYFFRRAINGPRDWTG